MEKERTYEVLLSYCITEDNNNSDLSNDRQYSNSQYSGLTNRITTCKLVKQCALIKTVVCR